ncbi:MAG: NUDIX hydrolase [Planctomycetes bacterium]|nr:NUDIX hydrolase [Planctomycetota bacterium]
MSHSTTIAEGRHLRLVQRGGWEFAQRRTCSSVVAIIAVTASNELVLTEQQRIPVGARVIDLPAGLVGDGADAGEPAVEAGRRELMEETGYASDDLSVVARFPTSPGMSDEVVTLIHARAAVRTGAGGGVEGEDIIVHLVALTQARTWLAERSAQGLLIDPKVYAAMWLVGNRP